MFTFLYFIVGYMFIGFMLASMIFLCIPNFRDRLTLEVIEDVDFFLGMIAVWPFALVAVLVVITFMHSEKLLKKWIDLLDRLNR